jgi:hypothetical protein
MQLKITGWYTDDSNTNATAIILTVTADNSTGSRNSSPEPPRIRLRSSMLWNPERSPIRIQEELIRKCNSGL